MIAAVIACCKSSRVLRIANCTVKVHAAVNFAGCSDPLVDFAPQLFPKVCIGSPALDRQQRFQKLAQQLEQAGRAEAADWAALAQAIQEKL